LTWIDPARQQQLPLFMLTLALLAVRLAGTRLETHG
jgi:hypothetical protein